MKRRVTKNPRKPRVRLCSKCHTDLTGVGATPITTPRAGDESKFSWSSFTPGVYVCPACGHQNTAPIYFMG